MSSAPTTSGCSNASSRAEVTRTLLVLQGSPNFESILTFFHEVKAIWRKWLSRRSNSRRLNWERMRTAEEFPLPRPAHRSPVRHVANPCPEEPDAGNPHVRICGSPPGSRRGATRQVGVMPLGTRSGCQFTPPGPPRCARGRSVGGHGWSPRERSQRARLGPLSSARDRVKVRCTESFAHYSQAGMTTSRLGPVPYP